MFLSIHFSFFHSSDGTAMHNMGFSCDLNQLYEAKHSLCWLALFAFTKKKIIFLWHKIIKKIKEKTKAYWNCGVLFFFNFCLWMFRVILYRSYGNRCVGNILIYRKPKFICFIGSIWIGYSLSLWYWMYFATPSTTSIYCIQNLRSVSVFAIVRHCTSNIFEASHNCLKYIIISNAVRQRISWSKANFRSMFFWICINSP